MTLPEKITAGDITDVQLSPYGEFEQVLPDGRRVVQIVDGEALRNILLNFSARLTPDGILVDADHQSEEGGSTEALAWVEHLRIDPEAGLIGRLRWTDKGAAAVCARRYRFVSPAWELGKKINLRPNARGGIYEASGHCAWTFITLGERTGATPDGRFAGDEMSKNLSPTMGMDRNGVTALIRSVTQIDPTIFPAGLTLDVMMHPATVQGGEGLTAMRGLLFTYLLNNGIAMNINIFDANVLEDAQRHPERYEGLQVRVCGWNVRFNDLSRKEQDAYIERARNIAE